MSSTTVPSSSRRARRREVGGEAPETTTAACRCPRQVAAAPATRATHQLVARAGRSTNRRCLTRQCLARNAPSRPPRRAGGPGGAAAARRSGSLDQDGRYPALRQHSAIGGVVVADRDARHVQIDKARLRPPDVRRCPSGGGLHTALPSRYQVVWTAPSGEQPLVPTVRAARSRRRAPALPVAPLRPAIGRGVRRRAIRLCSSRVRDHLPAAETPQTPLDQRIAELDAESATTVADARPGSDVHGSRLPPPGNRSAPLTNSGHGRPRALRSSHELAQSAS